MSNNIIINTPDTSMLGGVAAFYKNLNLKSYTNVDYFFIQHNSDRLFRLKKIFLYPAKFITFFIKCTQAATIVINPSFDKKSFLRDVLYLAIARHIFRRRVIVFWHGWADDFESEVAGSALYKFIVRKFYGSADQTIVLSGIFKRKLESLGYPANHNFYVSSVAADDSFLQHFQIERKYDDLSVVKLLFLSRIIAEKGIFRVIEMTRQLVFERNFTNIELWVAGEGEDLAKAKALVDELHLQKYVKFSGFVENREKYNLLYNAHILLFPTSFGEGMPVSILESMLYGLYIMTSRRGGISDVISEANGSLIDENDCTGYVDKLADLLHEKETIRKTGLFNHAYATRNYTSSIVKQKLYTIFNG